MLVVIILSLWVIVVSLFLASLYECEKRNISR